MQGALPLQAPVLGTLLGPSVDPAVGGVDIDEHQLPGAGQQRGAGREAGPALGYRTPIEYELLSENDTIPAAG